MSLGLYVAGFVFYVLFLIGCERLAAQCRSIEGAGDVSRASWLTLWREHQRSFPESRLRRGLLLQVAMVAVFVTGGMVLAYSMY